MIKYAYVLVTKILLIIIIAAFIFAIEKVYSRDIASMFIIKTNGVRFNNENNFDIGRKLDDAASRIGWKEVNDNTLSFDGRVVSKESFSGFTRIYKQGKTKTLVINSLGGDAIEAFKIGRIIQNDNLNVEVDGFCVSACANVMLISGNNIKVRGIIALHGTAVGRYFSDKSILAKLNPLHYLVINKATKVESLFYQGRENAYAYLIKTNAYVNDFYIPSIQELEHVIGKDIQGSIDPRYLCVFKQWPVKIYATSNSQFTDYYNPKLAVINHCSNF